jgi:predicted metal-dependent HD superfamily phosphohydrolase
MAALPPSLLLELTRRYGELHRHYHAIEHIAAMLHQGRELRLSDAQVLAIWFHDAVYEPARSDNEERSAQLARTWLLPALPTATVELVASIVLDTKAHAPSTAEAAPVIDLDLAPLAAPWPQFVANGELIRREYAHVAEAEFAAGRAVFLQRMLARPRIYWTPFGAALEPLARANLQRALAGGGQR